MEKYDFWRPERQPPRGPSLAHRFAAPALTAGPAWAAVRQTAAGPVSVEKMAGNLDTPWGLRSCRAGAFLVTERGGSLFSFRRRASQNESIGVPQVYAWGQGGLMDGRRGTRFPRNPRDFPHLLETLPWRGGHGARRRRAFNRQP